LRDDEKAMIVLRAFEVSSDGCWPMVRQALESDGYKPEEIVDAFASLAAIAEIENLVSLADF
jgi:alkylhydroperoxidase/carboxymuconolactone decarboxylase family protein YurZ